MTLVIRGALISSLRVQPRGLRTLLTRSRVNGPLQPPLSTQTLPSFYKEQLLEKHHDKPALVSRHEPSSKLDGNGVQSDSTLRWTFSEFDRQIDELAAGLMSHGVKKGDRVAVVLGNCSAYAVLQWACARLGAIIVTLNPAYKMHEMMAMLKLTNPTIIVSAAVLRGRHYIDEFADAIPSLKQPNLPRGLSMHSEIPNLRHVLAWDGTGAWMDHIAKVAPSAGLYMNVPFKGDVSRLPDPQGLNPDDVINLQFTSGTTGLPKAVSLTHRNLLNNALSIGACMRLQPGDKLCNVPPLFHCFGNLATWTHGGCIVYAAEHFNPAANLAAIVEEECTAVHGVPTHFLGLLDELEKRPDLAAKLKEIGKLRTGIAAGSPIPIELMRQLIDKLGLKDLSIAYGMTETSPVSFQTTPEDALVKRVETVGKVQPHVKAKIIDDEGHTVPIGEPGELCVSGYLVQKGYWMDDEQTKEVMRRHQQEEAGDEDIEWMHTGDMAIMDEEGYLSIVGRIKDVIIRGGENLFPVQIENVLSEHPNIHEASVVAVPDDKYGEVVGVWVKLRVPGKTTGQDIRAWVGDKMNRQNAPAWVWFMTEKEELPKTASGKVQKNILRDWSKERKQQGQNDL